jgi:hypothetical protein
VSSVEPFLDKEVAEFLKEQGFGNLYSDPYEKRIFVGHQPDTPTFAITVQEVGGGPPRLEISEARSIVIRVRHKSANLAKATAQQIHRALHEQQGVLPSTGVIRVARMVADTNPIPLGRDENKAFTFSQTFSVLTKVVEPSP